MNDLLRTHYWKNRERKTAFAVQDSNPWPREIGAYHWALDHWATTAVDLHWCVQHVFAFQLKDVDFYFFYFFFLYFWSIFWSSFPASEIMVFMRWQCFMSLARSLALRMIDMPLSSLDMVRGHLPGVTKVPAATRCCFSHRDTALIFEQVVAR